MSAAFDTVDREKLLNILESILDEDKIRIIQFLLSNTSISIRVNGVSKLMPFISNIRVPQGDGLSPVLFTIYLEAALRDVRIDLGNKELPTELAYADDVDFVSEKGHVNVNNVQRKLSRFNLNVNTDKTEHTELKQKESKVDEKWRETKKVGSSLGDNEYIERRKTLSNIAINKLFNIWILDTKGQSKIENANQIVYYISKISPLVQLWHVGINTSRRRKIKRIPSKAIETRHRDTLPY